MNTKILLITILLCASAPLLATHQRAAEITYKHIDGLTYEAKIITYTYTPSPADRPELTIDWGDGTSSILKRTQKINLPDNVSLNLYEYRPDLGATSNRHTYSSQGTYVLSMEDPNRNYGVVNIPNSVNVPMYTQSVLVINPFLGYNNSPVLLNPPIDVGCVNRPYYHNPGAYDIDGDSLSYRLIDCKTTGGIDIPGYTFPSASNVFEIDPITGTVTWDSPVTQGEYNIAILIEEWRSGTRIGSVTRDMQIEIIACSNEPPIIVTAADTCVEAGSVIMFETRAWDPDGSAVTLTASGGPFEVAGNPAVIDPNPAISEDTAVATFTWNTSCANVQKQPFQLFFKAEDDGFPVSLVNFRTVFIQVISPAPENLTAEPVGTSVELSWNRVGCNRAAGYRIYRRNGFYGFQPDHCETGVPAYTGYVLIGNTGNIGDTTFRDDNNGTGLIQGIEYCYMVTAYFQDDAESYASEEVCAILKRDVPVITNVSNDSTDLSAGRVYVAWSRPTELDTIQVPGPYQYVVYRSPGVSGSNLEEIAVKEGLDDTLHIDNGVNLNNSGNAFSYRIQLVSQTYGPVGFSQVASSIFLLVEPADEKLLLSWSPQVPWKNDHYVIYRRAPGEPSFDSLSVSAENFYSDTSLVNGSEYCYYIRSVGGYTAPGFVSPIENFSQFACGVPVDNEPPCPPELEVYTDCDRAQNFVLWTNPNHFCTDDVVKYYLYFTPLAGNDFVILDSILNPDDTSYRHQNKGNIVGCYMVTAIDSAGNVSDFSNVVCVEDTVCSQYSLPNVFTPNFDGFNDLYTPFPYTSVERIDIKIFNRWGKIVYETSDPDINWDGRNQNNNTECEQGTYFYICKVYEITLLGVRQRTLQGAITLLR